MITSEDIGRIRGTDVYGADDSKIGTAGQIYLDNASGSPEWVSVKTGLFGTKESFVPLTEASFTGDRVQVPYDKDRVKNAPRIDADGDLTPEEEQELYRYYGISAESTGRPGTAGYTDTDSAYARTGTTDTSETYARDTGTETRTAGHDTSGPNTDDAMTRSEERLVAGTQTEERGKARLRKYVVTEQEQVTVPVSREEVRLEREPITEGNVDRAMDGPAISEEEHEVTLRAERPVVDTEAVPVERVRLNKETVTEQETVGGEVRKEQIDLDEDTTHRR
ncbi:DUF2382 domain-containing protein [Spirilliplanes yamanashiensis]|uniref:Photosystem reaction center subunit H n=1 Tax=Spirilliplanes yamanashiensis TaxID=42233 RepID=A0A8J4DKK8_9ACTN|nr:PRC and DUF2382 domain-containing protein [Spirilliplanes yamanashiensis]MDP9818957.1 uncharacterized protein (TIGR02271 family) [Spirilliplanes yamanashiensis]GIJ05412.1 photosystem reaction center subunit H [Spirilliplanes yamanashiensis]